MSANLDPMVYPLFFPRGDAGWHNQLVHNPERATLVRNHVTLSQFYNYRLSVRQFFCSLFYGKKLFQQYAVDAYVKIEGQRLAFIRNNQNKLRSEQCDALHEHINNIANDRNIRPGRVVVLPSSYVGSPRALKENFEDAMAIIKKYGKPDLFITFTCNPKWREITENLYPGQNANDRPDLVTRVFKLKLNNLLNDIFKHGVLGKVVTHVQVIEFQKRGLAHAHILLHLANDNKLETSQDIDNLICAEIPDPIVNCELYDIIKTCMIHGHVDFNANTVAVHNGYPRYRRRDNGLVINIKGNNVDNRWVVPYNPWLSKKYQAHINVEACMSVKAVKYLEGEEQVALDCAAQRDTHLTAWFKLNSENEGANRYSYVDIPYHFVFDDKHCKWKVRQRGGNKVIVRMYKVSPTGELFFLRLLLLQAKGAKSWEDLRTVNGIVLETFRETCVFNGLLQDDTEWQNTLSEAVLTRMPKQIRHLFSIILTFCEPDDPLHHWNSYKTFMMEDFIHRQVPFILAEQATLLQIEKIINQSGKTLSDYNLPVVDEFIDFNLENLNDNVQQSIDEANRMRPLLNVNQLNVSNALNEQPCVENQHSRLFFMDGPAGSGKTFTYNCLIAEMSSRGVKSATAA
ncbi:uncharacterized protein LOC136072347 [Hydra vulgaris]|uniref:uncharacterized protein LOC136072347 n=1 Tax=Hydra vulgaris TaxID=6087 RepID=UPI0032EA5611